MFGDKWMTSFQGKYGLELIECFYRRYMDQRLAVIKKRMYMCNNV